jgi:aspartate racemase
LLVERDKIVGVIGGLGPEATLDFFGKILEATTAATDQDHLHLIIDNNPLAPDRTEAVAGIGPSPGPSLACTALRLEEAGAEVLVMVCNTAHAFSNSITDVVQIPFLNIIEVTCEAAMKARPSLQRAGVLATEGALSAGLYEDALNARGIEHVALEGASRARFMELIMRIKGGDKSDEVRTGMRLLALELVELGAEVIIAGCTEVPLVLDAEDYKCPLVNSTDALVTRTIQYARYNDDDLEPTPEIRRHFSLAQAGAR